MVKICVICDNEFRAPPSSKKITCSKECSTIRKSQSHKGKSNVWSDGARMRISDAGMTTNLYKGTLAAQKSPIAGRFKTHHSAKRWRLVTPYGETIEVQNLLYWARENCHLFDKPQNDASANAIRSGFLAIAQTMRGKRGGEGQQRAAWTYFGWTMAGMPEDID